MKPVKSLFWVCVGMAALTIVYLHVGIVALQYYTKGRKTAEGNRVTLDKVGTKAL